VNPKFLKCFFPAGFLLLLPVIFSFLPEESLAAKRETEIFGTAWSSNIGWVRFNNCDAPNTNCGSAPYSVVLDNQNGHITGEAWSASVGWIKFGELFSFPTGDGTIEDNAKVNLSQGSSRGKVTGWARACGGTLPGDCSSMTPRTDGWDGWISLSGTDHPSSIDDGSGGVTYLGEDENGGEIVGKAWGGDFVGWIDFADVFVGPPEDDDENFDFSLTNSTIETGPIIITQSNSGNVSVTRTLVSGDPEEVTITTLPASPSPLPGSISTTVETNNPCEPDPWCTSTVRIDVSSDVPVGNYTFIARGTSEGELVLVRDTVVSFKVVEQDAIPTLSCRAVTGPPFWLYQPVVWQVEVIGGTGSEEEVSWWGDLGNSRCIEEKCHTLITSYPTVGPKSVQASVEGGEIVNCARVRIRIRALFREF
jgi:hypothetical protein